MKISFEKRLIFFFILIFIGIAILGVVTYRTNRSTVETNKWVAHTKEVIAEAETVLSFSKDIVMGSQRYVLTNDSSFLGLSTSSKNFVSEHIIRLKELTKDNPVQQDRVDSIGFLMKNSISFTDMYIRLRKEDGLETASRMIARGRGKFYSDKLRDLINQIETEENALLVEKQKDNDINIKNFNNAFYTLLTTVFIFLAVVFFYILYNLNKITKAERDIRQTNKFLDTILENIPNMIFVKDAEELRFVRFNKAGEQLLGYSRKDLLGKNDYDFFPKEQADFFTNNDKDVIRKGDLLDIPEEPINTASGERLLHTKKIPISDEQGKPVYLLGISEDITERKKADQHLKDLNEQFIKIFNLSPVAMSISNFDDGRITQANESFEKLFLMNKDEVIGKTFSELRIRRPEERDEITKYLQRSGGHVRGVEMRLGKSNGEILEALVSIETIEIENKKYALSAAMDITGQKRSQQRLKELNERFLKIFNVSPVAMAISNMEDGRFMQVNETFEKLLLIKKEEVIGKNSDELKIVSSRNRDENIENIKKEGGHTRDLEMRLRKTNGELIDALLSIETIDIDNTKCFLTAFVDITSRKKAEEQIKHLNSELQNYIAQLEAVNKELEAFSYSVSHDLRAPLRIIDGFAGILANDYKDKLDEEGNKTINIIRTNAMKMGQLIDDLLNLSRLGRKALSFNEVDMDQLVRQIINEQGEHYHAIEIKIGKLEPVNGDRNLLMQVWRNLISNACKYSAGKEKPVIEIGSYIKDGEIIYFVKDNGVGFDMHYADKLFGVFQRLHKMSEFEGTGVGLAIAKRIIIKHGGKMWADAEVNKGATFYFSLPDN